MCALYASRSILEGIVEYECRERASRTPKSLSLGRASQTSVAACAAGATLASAVEDVGGDGEEDDMGKVLM